MTKTPKTCSEKYPYKSKYTAGYINAANYITELIFEKRNEFFNSGKNPEKFWNQEKYNGIYKKELFGTYRLLKMFEEKNIIDALKSPKTKYVLKISYNRFWDDAKFINENRVLIDAIKEFSNKSNDRVLEKTTQIKKEIVKKQGNSKNLFKDL